MVKIVNIVRATAITVGIGRRNRALHVVRAGTPPSLHAPLMCFQFPSQHNYGNVAHFVVKLRVAAANKPALYQRV